jgi:hypothetical protein
MEATISATTNAYGAHSGNFDRRCNFGICMIWRWKPPQRIIFLSVASASYYKISQNGTDSRTPTHIINAYSVSFLNTLQRSILLLVTGSRLAKKQCPSLYSTFGLTAAPQLRDNPRFVNDPPRP